jgi:hypothetical protein
MQALFIVNLMSSPGLARAGRLTVTTRARSSSMSLRLPHPAAMLVLETVAYNF